ncbi:hypothetical protein NTGM5_130009 [Candidatus Nitrotoga sp. M5]|nr:hypothetical protein NTGM5_130009 [Candidatus Nitrotoga sp. M5]
MGGTLKEFRALKKFNFASSRFAANLLISFRLKAALLEKNYRLHFNIYAVLKFFIRALP